MAIPTAATMICMDTALAFDDRADDYVARVEQALQQRLPAADTTPSSLHGAMRYAILGGGKRIRPLLCYATGETLGVAVDQLDAAACALELIHGFSLVHDDLPAMDDDALRRGQPTVHKAYGNATAILAGDGLQTLAFQFLARDDANTASARTAMIGTLTAATGASGMTGGQILDLEAEGVAIDTRALEDLNRRKTGCLIRASVLMAADACPGTEIEQREALDTFASHMGLAFQIRDDLLDIEGDQTVTGKTGGADAELGKSTWPSLLGVTGAKERADEEYTRAMDALTHLPANTAPLQSMARRLVYRDR